MRDLASTVRAWVGLAGLVLVIGVLSWGQAVIVPVALAMLLTFLLAPAATWLQRWIGRVPAVLVLVVFAFSLLGVAGWGLLSELTSLANELPGYRANIRQKIADVRGVGSGGSVAKVQQTLNEIQTEITKSAPARPANLRPALVAASGSSLESLSVWVGPLLGPLGLARVRVSIRIAGSPRGEIETSNADQSDTAKSGAMAKGEGQLAMKFARREIALPASSLRVCVSALNPRMSRRG